MTTPEQRKSWCLARQKYRLNNPEKVQKANKKWRIKNQDKIKAIDKARSNVYRRNNRERINLYFRTRAQKNPIFRLIVRTRTRVYQTLCGISKSVSTFELLGCSLSELWEHLESKFVPGMTRENYGPVWHVDHIRPCASFDLTDPEQQRECFNYKNLQPLFALDNLRKGAKYGPNF